MTTQISQELLTKQIYSLLQETFEKVEGIYLDRSTSLLESLDSVTATEASTPITKEGTSIASQVHHTRFYLKVLNDYMDGKPANNADWKGSWIVSRVSSDEWIALRQSLRSDYDNLKKKFQSFADWNDERRLGGALAVIVHTAYHLGAIRQIMRVVKLA